jgi:mannose-6-phosphate isomerase-like protein (cupin superfamily)
MTNVNRRDVLVMLSALTAVGGVSVEAEAQSAPSVGEHVLDKSEAFAFDALPVKKNANGGASRAVVAGALVTGEAVEVHETTLPPGQMPHPPHKHRHSEFMMIREGTVEFDMDGVRQEVGPGGVLFAASGVMHGLKNVGEVNANYFVIAIGREAAAGVA